MPNDIPAKSRALPRPHDWTDVLAPEVIKQFVGKHIAIVYKRVIASGTSYNAVLEECIRLFPDETPYMAYIPTAEEAQNEESATHSSNIAGPTLINETVRSVSRIAPVRREHYGYTESDDDLAINLDQNDRYTDTPADDEIEEDGEMAFIRRDRTRNDGAEPDGTSTIHSIVPSSGPVGTVVTITGDDFTGITEVQFNGVSATAFSLSSETSLSVVVPSDATSGVVSVKTPHGIDFSRPGFYVVPPPAITGFTPVSGGIGARVTISGASLKGAHRVSFNGALQPTLIQVTNGTLVVVVPFGAVTGPISIITDGGTATSEDVFTVVRAPRITGFSEQSAGVGSTIAIFGTDLSDALAVKFGGAHATDFTVVSPAEISAVVPAVASTGLVSVTTPGGLTAGSQQFEVIPAPTIYSFAPAAGVVGAEIVLSGAHFDGADAVVFEGADPVVPSFVSEDSVHATVPDGAKSGLISIVTRGGKAFSAEPYTLIPFPAISDLSPAAIGAGERVQIVGSGLLNATSVSFNGVDAERFSVESESSISAIVPPSALSGAVRVTTPGGIAASESDFTFVPQPHVYSAAPRAAGIGAEVVIDGNNLSGALLVLFGEIAAERIDELSDNRLLVIVPEGAINGSATITVATLGGRSTGDVTFTTVYPPEIEDFVPEVGPAGTFVNLRGQNFVEGVTLKFGEVPSHQVVVTSPGSLGTVVPAGAVTGRISLSTVGGEAVAPRAFTVLQPPAIVAFDPDTHGVGAPVNISGLNFDDVLSVTFAGVEAEFEALTSESLVANVPEGASTGPIVVKTSGGAGTSATDFTFIPLPHIDRFEPVSAPAGHAVTVIGAHFSDASSVSLAGRAVGEFDVLSDSTILVKLHEDTQSGTFAVTTRGGRAEAESPFTVTPPPVIQALSPSTAGVGQTIRIVGEHLLDASDITFNDVPAGQYSVESNTVVIAEVPEGDVTGEVAVTTPAGRAASLLSFQLIPRPVVETVTPAYEAVGKEVRIAGGYLYDVLSVAFGTVEAPNFVDLNDRTLMVKVPEGAQSGVVTVTTQGGASVDDVRFTVAEAPELHSVAPAVATVGTLVTINGLNFTENAHVTFNSVEAQQITVLSDSTIEVVVPPGATSGPLAVTVVGGSAELEESFTVLQPPVIESFTPVATGVGKTITIFGSNFSDVTGVSFSDVPAAFTVESLGLLQVEVPAGAVTGPVQIVTRGGIGASAQEFTLVERPVIVAFEPTIAAAGETVTIYGHHLETTSNVTLAGMALEDFNVVSDTALTVKITPHSSDGFFGIVTSGGTAVSGFDFKFIPAPVINSFTPAAAGIGKTVRLYGTGLSSASSVIFNDAPALEITVESDWIINAVVPQDALSGEIRVVAPGGEAVAETIFNLIPDPTIDSISPTAGPIGTDVTINGQNLSSVTSVSFGKLETSEVVVLSDGSIIAKVPEGADSGEIGVSTMGGTALSEARFFVVHPPVVDRFEPESAPVGALVVVHGSNFVEDANVQFNGIEASEIVVVSPHRVEAVVPPSAVTGRISVSTAGGSAKTSAKFAVIQPPVIEDFMPLEGGIGTSVSVLGSNFIDVTLVKLNEFSCAFTVKSAASLVVEVPDFASTGRISVVTSAGTALSEKDFIVLMAPAISGFNPAAGPAGSVVTLSGEGFHGASGVKLSGRDVSEFRVLSDAFISVTVGPYASAGQFTVTTPGGVATSENRFQLISPPVVKRFVPASGGVGSSISVLGDNFVGVTAVTVGGAAAPEFSELSDTELSVIIPNGVASGVITVSTTAGTSSSSAKFGVLPAPVIKSFTPAIDGVGAKVMITGSALSGANLVKFNGVVASKYTVISATFVSVEVPPDATTGPISITTSGGTALSQTDFQVLPQPIIHSLSTEAGPVGSKVTINGENLAGTTRVTLNGITQANVVVESEHAVTFEVAENAESGVISLNNAGGTAESPSSFTVIPLPAIISFTPASGPAGTVITVTGVTLDSATSAAIGGVKANVASLSSSKAKVFVPNDASTGLVSISTRYGACVSEREFEVIASASITDIAPPSGPAGSTVMLSGRGFAGATAVVFGGVYSPSITVHSATSITAQVPFGARSGDVQVQLPTGAVLSTKAFQVTLSIISFEPGSGAAGTVVTITGVGFDDLGSVSFGGVDADILSASSTSITAYAPITGIDGPIQVIAANGSTISQTSFFYPPTIIGITPESGPATTLLAIAMSKNVDLTNEECHVEFSNGARVLPNFIDPMDHVVYIVLPEGASSGPVRVTTRGGVAESPRHFEVTEE